LSLASFSRARIPAYAVLFLAYRDHANNRRPIDDGRGVTRLDAGGVLDCADAGVHATAALISKQTQTVAPTMTPKIR